MLDYQVYGPDEGVQTPTPQQEIEQLKYELEIVRGALRTMAAVLVNREREVDELSRRLSALKTFLNDQEYGKVLKTRGSK